MFVCPVCGNVIHCIDCAMWFCEICGTNLKDYEKKDEDNGGAECK